MLLPETRVDVDQGKAEVGTQVGLLMTTSVIRCKSAARFVNATLYGKLLHSGLSLRFQLSRDGLHGGLLHYRTPLFNQLVNDVFYKIILY